MPRGKSGACGADGGVNVLCGTLRDVGEFFCGGGIGGFEIICFGGGVPGAVDEMVEATLVAIEPGDGFSRIFGGRAVVHGDEFFCEAHGGLIVAEEELAVDRGRGWSRRFALLTLALHNT